MITKITLKYFFLALILFSFYHLLRDILQIFHIENFASTFLKTDKNWCSSYCNFITVPFELFILGGGVVIVKRNRVGVLGFFVISVFLIWTTMFLYDYFVFN